MPAFEYCGIYSPLGGTESLQHILLDCPFGEFSEENFSADSHKQEGLEGSRKQIRYIL